MNKIATLFSLLFLSFSMGAESLETLSATNTTLCNCDMTQYENAVISSLVLSFGAFFLSCYSIFFSWRSYRRAGYAVITN